MMMIFLFMARIRLSECKIAGKRLSEQRKGRLLGYMMRKSKGRFFPR